MHAGPVYEEFDPILKKRNFFGRHVNQAARIEPIVLPGSVFVSETVAALISFGYEKYDFEYAGNLELAKDFGSYPIYMLQRKGTPKKTKKRNDRPTLQRDDIPEPFESYTGQDPYIFVSYARLDKAFVYNTLKSFTMRK